MLRSLFRRCLHKCQAVPELKATVNKLAMRTVTRRVYRYRYSTLNNQQQPQKAISLSFQASKILDEFLPLQHTTSTPYPKYTAALELRRQFPNHQHIVLTDCQLPLTAYLESQKVNYQVSDRLKFHEFSKDSKLISQLQIGVVNFTWMNTDFQLFKFICPSPYYDEETLHVLVFVGRGEAQDEKDKIGVDLLTAAYKWKLNTREEIWMFSEGKWSKDSKLYKAIKSSEWDSLVLQQEFIDGLKRDTETFFSSQEIYRSLGIPWKRGLLLLGPPGNGKTQSIKVLLKEANIPALYVKSFEADGGGEYGIRAIFEFARRQAPCILVLEDLDSMVVPSLRAFFLNEMDGLEQNDGILTIATSNHPEKIDSAILNRPSRFDVKYTFDLPAKNLRKLYVKKWTVKARNLSGIEFSESLIDKITEQTDGFSFAFMKELFVSFLLRLAHDRTAKKEFDIENLMRTQIQELQIQIHKRH